jgi:gliding motility-associated-like protein
MPSFTYNFSQELCAIPRDTIAPCAPKLSVTNACSEDNAGIDDDYNHLTWSMENNPCHKDVVGYYIYYSENKDIPLQVVDTVKPATALTFKHNHQNAVSGCYAVAAFDSAYNVSPLSNIMCMENCANYELPNVFTPNGDGHNDVYHPFLPYSFIDHVEMSIYNKWGGLIFETKDPMINWDGTDQKSGKAMQTGTYYYKCRVFEIQETGVVERKKPLGGYIELVR